MTRYQIITTSSRTNVENSGPGEKAYTYTKGFGELRANPEYDVLLKYRYPSDPNPSAPIEDIIQYMPKSFIFRCLANGMYAFAYNAYSGYDYRGERGARRGNILKHAIVCEKEDVTHYPCEYFKSSIFCEYISHEQLNSEDPPDYMPEPDIIPGDTISIDSVKTFLCSDESREEIFKKLVSALIHLSSSNKKRIVICDDKENIIFWIAAVEYVFPIETAKSIEFNTYVYDPKDSKNPIICGVFPNGTDYESADIELNHQAYLFDLKKNIIPDVPIDDSFYSFIAEGLCAEYPESYNIILEFHDFLNGLNGVSVSDNFSGSYSYYNLLTLGLVQIGSKEEFESALDFIKTLQDYQSRKRELFDKLVNEINILSNKNDDELVISVLSFIYENSPSGELPANVMEMILKSLISKFASETVTEKSFRDSYDKLKKISGDKFDLTKESLDEMIQYLNSDSDGWKLDFICKLLKDYKSDAEKLYNAVSSISNNTAIDEIKKKDALHKLYSELSDNVLRNLLEIYIRKSYGIPEPVIEEFINRISLKEPSDDDLDILKKLVHHRSNYLTLAKDKKTAGRLHLMVVGMNLKGIKRNDVLSEAVKNTVQSKSDVSVNRVSLESLTDSEADDYLLWITSETVPKSKTEKDFTSVYKLYKFTPWMVKSYLRHITVILSKDSGIKIDYKGFAEFLRFIYVNKLDSKDNLKEILGVLNKPAYNAIDEHIPRILAGDKALKIWVEIKEIKDSSSPMSFFKNTGGFFKRK